jgi:nitroreductase
MINDLVRKNRSYRRFDESVNISIDDLKELVNLARLSPSGKNLQPMKFFISNDKSINEKIFPHLAWAGYLKDWTGPKEGERPSAYIIMLIDKELSENAKWDEGIFAQSIMLGAVEKGFGGCMIASVKRQQLKEDLKLPDHLEINLVLALGKPIEVVEIEEMKNDDYKYWRNEEKKKILFQSEALTI